MEADETVNPLSVSGSTQQEQNNVFTQLPPATQDAGASEPDWVRLALTLREPEIEILRMVYLPEPGIRSFPEVYTRLERLHYSTRTARRRIALLAAGKLLFREYSGVGFVIPVKESSAKVQRMLVFLEKRRRFPETGSGITDEFLDLWTEDGGSCDDGPRV
jgi:hypothetical protein